MSDATEVSETKEPKIRQVTLEWDGVFYTLQHPGNRAFIKKYQEFLTGDWNIEGLLDWAFEEVVHPQKGDKLSIDTIPLRKWQDWAGLLVTFLGGGELDPDFKWSDFDGTEFLSEIKKKKKKSARSYSEDVDRNWKYWRPITRRVLSKTEADPMTLHELTEVNAAIDRADTEMAHIIHRGVYGDKKKK